MNMNIAQSPANPGSAHDCPPGPTFRDVQCSEFDSKPHNGKLFTWKTYPPPNSDPNPCALFCINDKKVYAKKEPRVKDGTRCKVGTKDTCIQGSCLHVGCDWKINSDAVEDVCGICNGDGTHCVIVDETVSDVPKQGGYNALVVVPAGATNIHFEEVTPTGNMIAVSALDNKTYYLNGKFTEMLRGEYDFGGGVKGIYEKPEKSKGEVHIKGPTTEPLVLWAVYVTQQNEGLRYKFSVPTDKPMYTPKYHWEFTEWSECSAKCGGGTQIMKEACVEERDGKVKDSFCKDLTKDEPRARACNDQPCQTRWKVWKWGPCSGCLFKTGTRTRQVECVKESPTMTGDEEIICEPSECCGEMPKKSELCNSPKPCPKNETTNIVKKREVKVVPIKWLDKRESADGGKSFSDIPSTTAHAILDKVNPNSIHFQEVLLEENPVNLTEKEFEEIGDEVPDQLLSCEVANLTGKEALERLSEVIHGTNYHKQTESVESKGAEGGATKTHTPHSTIDTILTTQPAKEQDHSTQSTEEKDHPTQSTKEISATNHPSTLQQSGQTNQDLRQTNPKCAQLDDIF